MKKSKASKANTSTTVAATSRPGNTFVPLDAARTEQLTKLWAGIKHFKPSEFDSPDAPGSGLLMNIEFVKILDQIREKCGFSLKVTSGYRTVAHNAKVGGVDASSHGGNAADLAVRDGHDRFFIMDAARECGIKRIGIGKGLIHLDMSYQHPQYVVWTYPNK